MDVPVFQRCWAPARLRFDRLPGPSPPPALAANTTPAPLDPLLWCFETAHVETALPAPFHRQPILPFAQSTYSYQADREGMCYPRSACRKLSIDVMAPGQARMGTGMRLIHSRQPARCTDELPWCHSVHRLGTPFLTMASVSAPGSDTCLGELSTQET
jgi:hypothetical protein